MDFYTDCFKFRRGPALVRFINVSPGTRPLDIYSDECKLECSISYGEISEYRNMAGGSHIIRAYRGGGTEGALENRKISLCCEEVYTIAIGDFKKTGLHVIPEPEIEPPFGKALIRVVHLSPIVDPIDIILPCGRELFKNVNYEEITDYMAVDPDAYSLSVKKSCYDRIIYKAMDIVLEPDETYTIYAAGLMGCSPRFRLILTQDGYFLDC